MVSFDVRDYFRVGRTGGATWVQATRPKVARLLLRCTATRALVPDGDGFLVSNGIMMDGSSLNGNIPNTTTNVFVSMRFHMVTSVNSSTVAAFTAEPVRLI